MIDIRLTFVAVAAAVCFAEGASAADWPQWGGTESKNMVSAEKGLPSSFTPGEKGPKGGIQMDTARNVRWAVAVGHNACSTPAVAGGKVFLGSVQDNEGLLLCLDEASGKRLWQWKAPPRGDVPPQINGRKLNFGTMQMRMGVCSSPLVEAGRVYFVDHRCSVVCLDARGNPGGPEENNARVLWTFDMWKLGVRPSDACNSSAVIDGDCLYVGTSNGVDRLTERADDALGTPPAPQAPNLIVLD